MIYIEPLAAIGNTINHRDVTRDVLVVTEFLDYLRWLAEQDTSYQLTAGQVWELYYMGVVRGYMWSEVCVDIGLPEREDWT